MFLSRNSYLNTQSEVNTSRRSSTVNPNLAGNRRKTAFRPPPEKREMSENVKKIARRLFYKVKLYNMLERAKRQVKTHVFLLISLKILILQIGRTGKSCIQSINQNTEQ